MAGAFSQSGTVAYVEAVMPVSGPTVVRRQLGRRLRALRDRAGKSMVDMAATKIMSPAKLYRIEGGTTTVRISDVWSLCRIYGCDDKTTDALAALAAGTNGRGWWHDYGDIMPADFELYLGLEAAASAIRIYEPERVHGLFQTADYAREIERATNITLRLGAETVERYVALRMERQKTVFSRTPPCQIVAILGAGALARTVGGSPVMAEQVERLHELFQLDHVDIRVLPFSVGAHAAMLGAFAVMDFEDPDDPPVAYFETYSGARFLEQSGQLEQHRAVFQAVYQQSTPIEEYEGR
jgi:transcriptional regulator with XRE-family HTH domain